MKRYSIVMLENDWMHKEDENGFFVRFEDVEALLGVYHAARIDEQCPDTGKSGHNHPANPCWKCEGTGRITAEQGQNDDE